MIVIDSKRGESSHMVEAIIVGICIILDVITGLMKALSEKNISSTKLRKGLLHKASEVVTVAGMYGLQFFLSQSSSVTLDLPLYSVTVTYISIMEIISVIENLCIINPQLYKLFAPYLSALNQKGGGTNDNDK